MGSDCICSWSLHTFYFNCSNNSKCSDLKMYFSFLVLVKKMLNLIMAVVTGDGSLTFSSLVLGSRWASGTFGASPICATRMEEVNTFVLYI